MIPAGYEGIELEWEAGSRNLTLYIERRDGLQVDLNSCVEVNHLLEDFEPLNTLKNGNYQLEISSPGIERPIRRLSDFEKYIGRMITVRLTEKQADRKQGTGQIKGVDSDKITLVLDNQLEWTFPINFVFKAKLNHDWN